MNRIKVTLLLLVFISNNLYAKSDLLFLELEGVAGYSDQEKKAIYHSASKHDSMQKNSIGIDYIHKFSNEKGDYGTTALQFRLSYNDAEKEFESHLYNAYFKYKSRDGDYWIGHNRLAFGISSYIDNHSDLISDLSMQGVGYDRDWGIGYSKDKAHGNISLALTYGSGMDLRTYGNYLITARISNGVLNYDNFTNGISFMAGKNLSAMGYKVMDKTPKKVWLLGYDYAYNVDNIEHKIELDGGQRNDLPYYAALYRLKVKLDNEERYVWDIQPTYVLENKQENWDISNQISYRVNGDLILRFMHQYKHRTSENLCIAQAYWYFAL